MARAGGEFSEGGGGTPQGGISRPSADSPSAPALHWEKPSPAGGHMGRPYKGYETAPLIRLAFGQPPSPKGEGLRATARVALAAENGLEALVRQSQARLWNRTRPNFPPDQAPVGRNETQTTTQILRAGNTPPSQRDDPRNRGSGADSPCQGEMSRSDRGGRVGEYGHEVSILSRPPRPCLKNVNMPQRRFFFRHTALIFLAIHKVLPRQIALSGEKRPAVWAY